MTYFLCLLLNNHTTSNKMSIFQCSLRRLLNWKSPNVSVHLRDIFSAVLSFRGRNIEGMRFFFFFKSMYRWRNAVFICRSRILKWSICIRMQDALNSVTVVTKPFLPTSAFIWFSGFLLGRTKDLA